MLNRSFGHSVQRNGADKLIETHEQMQAMAVLMSGMFDKKLKDVKAQIAVLEKHEYAIRTSEEVDAMKAEIAELLDRAKSEREMAETTLSNAATRAQEIVTQAKVDAQAAVQDREKTLSETHTQAAAILQEARTEANGIRAAIKRDGKTLVDSVDNARIQAAGWEAKITASQAELQSVRETIANEKARMLQLFGNTAS